MLEVTRTPLQCAIECLFCDLAAFLKARSYIMVSRTCSNCSKVFECATLKRLNYSFKRHKGKVCRTPAERLARKRAQKQGQNARCKARSRLLAAEHAQQQAADTAAAARFLQSFAQAFPPSAAGQTLTLACDPSWCFSSICQCYASLHCAWLTVATYMYQRHLGTPNRRMCLRHPIMLLY